jgi:RsiW-degrading membrane proteinase PrsW (M82 family)
MGIIASIFLGFIPIFLYAAFIYWLDRYDKEPLILLGAVFFWGAVMAAAGAFIINTLFGVGIFAITGSETAADLTTGSLIAPIVEEILKGMAVYAVYLMARSEFDSVLDGIIYAAITALGFAATENSFYIYNYGYQPDGWMGVIVMTFIRVFLVGWQHPFYTSFFGIGVALARMNRNKYIRIIYVLLGLAAAIFTHSFHNTLASMFTDIGGMALGTFVDWSGWFIMLLFIIAMIYREKRNLRVQLREEVELGTITVAQYETACSAWRQSRARMVTFGKRGYRATNRLYRLCGELAHKKQQYLTMGDEDGNLIRITELRGQIRDLSPAAF